MSLLRFDIKQSGVLAAVLMALISVSIFTPIHIFESPVVQYIFFLEVLIVFFFACILLFIEKTITSFDSAVILFVLLIGVVSVLNGAEWRGWLLYNAFPIVSYIILFHFFQGQYKALVIGTLIVLSIGVYLQLFQCVMHPEMWLIREEREARGYILGGNYNQIGSRVLLAFTLGMMSVRYNRWWWLNLIPLLATGLAVQFMVKSMTSLTCICLFLLLCLIRNKRLMKVALICLYTGWILFQFFVCIGGFGMENSETASWFVEDVLGKDMTFTYRYEMWDAAKNVIVESPALGYGFVDTDWFSTNVSALAFGAHNFILNTMLQGGVVGVFLYFIMLVLCICHLRWCSDWNSLGFLAAFGILSIMMLFESYPIPIVFIFLTYVYYFPVKNQNSLST